MTPAALTNEDTPKKGHYHIRCELTLTETEVQNLLLYGFLANNPLFIIDTDLKCVRVLVSVEWNGLEYKVSIYIFSPPLIMGFGPANSWALFFTAAELLAARWIWEKN